MKTSHLGPFLLGVAAGAAVGLLLAPEAPQRWKRKARAGVERGREAAGVLREAAEVFQEFRQLGRPLEEEA
jgi:gas vesicle protein